MAELKKEQEERDKKAQEFQKLLQDENMAKKIMTGDPVKENDKEIDKSLQEIKFKDRLLLAGLGLLWFTLVIYFNVFGAQSAPQKVETPDLSQPGGHQVDPEIYQE